MKFGQGREFETFKEAAKIAKVKVCDLENHVLECLVRYGLLQLFACTIVECKRKANMCERFALLDDSVPILQCQSKA